MTPHRLIAFNDLATVAHASVTDLCYYRAHSLDIIRLARCLTVQHG